MKMLGVESHRTSWPHRNLITTQRPHFQIPSHDGVRFQHMNSRGEHSVSNAVITVSAALSGMFLTGRGFCFDCVLRTKSFTSRSVYQRITRTLHRPPCGSVRANPAFPFPCASAARLCGNLLPPCPALRLRCRGQSESRELLPCWDGQQSLTSIWK